MRETDKLGIGLAVPDSRLKKIAVQFSGDPGQQMKEFVSYFVDHDPLASWRQVIVALDWIGEKEAADKIRHLAEPVTGIYYYKGVCVVKFLRDL